jgi:hypothetical protein
MNKETTLLTIKEASKWAAEYLKKKITSSNISYLVQYGRISRHVENGVVKVSQQELIAYYQSYLGREVNWKAELGSDVNWALSFERLKETDTTKHVHRLHPYKGKFIPQLVEYFMDGHTDEFKKEVYFNPGDVVLDPFCGSGTTLVQANELGIHAVGVDVSEFNALVGNIGTLSDPITTTYHCAKHGKICNLVFLIPGWWERYSIEGISDVLKNCKKFLSNDYNIFLVANDKYNLYPSIAEKAGMQIFNQFKRPVLNRTEPDKAAYAETIFHFKSN